MKSKLLQKRSYRTTQLREVVDGQHENIEGSSVPWRGRETGVPMCGSTMWAKGKALLRHQTVGPKRRPRSEICGIRPRPVTLRRPSITVSKETLRENARCPQSSCGLSVALSGFQEQKKDPRSPHGSSEGCPKFPFLASPRRGKALCHAAYSDRIFRVKR
jgi:hypothetical protein